MTRAEASVDRILSVLESGATVDYIGEPLSQLAHARQCAALAVGAGANDELVLAALLHDIGHVVGGAASPRMAEGLGVVEHERVGAEFLSLHGMRPVVVELVRGHVQAKRYLVATRQSYAAKLSAASTRTLAHQGGPMTPDEVRAFESSPLFRRWLQLRAWDEQAKDPDRNVPSVDAYRDRLIAHVSAPGGPAVS